MADWGDALFNFHCNDDEFNAVYSTMFKEYNGTLRLNFNSFIDNYTGDGSEYDPSFRWYITDESEEFRHKNHCFSFYCKSRSLIQYIVICLSELIDCDFDVCIYHPSYQSNLFYQIKNKKLRAEKEVVYYGQCGPDCCELCSADGVDEFGDTKWHCNEECVTWTIYDGDTGFEKLKKEIKYDED